MEKRRGFWLQVLLLPVAQSSALRRDKQLYFMVGSKLLLNPSVFDGITSVVRKHNFNLVAKWNTFDPCTSTAPAEGAVTWTEPRHIWT